MKQIFLKNRYSILNVFIFIFLIISTLLRLFFTAISTGKAGLGLDEIIIAFGKGFIYDVGVGIYFSLLYSLYLLILPQNGTDPDSTGFLHMFCFS